MARRVLDATCASWEAVRTRLWGRSAARAPVKPEVALSALQALQAIDKRPEVWLRRLAEELSSLGVVEPLSRRASVRSGRKSLDPRPRVVALSIPDQVRIVVPDAAPSLAVSLFSADALGRAVALSWTQSGLPAAFSFPLAGSVGRTLGVLFAQLLADPTFVSRCSGVSVRASERFASDVAMVLLFELRWTAAASLAGASENPRQLFHEAVSVDVPEPLRFLATKTPTARRARLGARLSGLALPCVLRERFNEDWFRNPRAGKPLLGAASQGGQVSSEALFRLCDSELSADTVADLCAERVLELLG